MWQKYYKTGYVYMLTGLSIWYIQSIAELKYANILDAFHEFTVQTIVAPGT
jgi:hypothetical protein